MSESMPLRIEPLLEKARRGDDFIVVLTGAGISAESGIPTFRGADGFWSKGSSVYRPEELATYAFFSTSPELQWPWYLYRRSACLKAEPNAAHQALVRLEEAYPDRFVLVTQNVDGLHGRAGQSKDRTLEIHGNLGFMRCSKPCNTGVVRVPSCFDDWPQERALGDDDSRRLRCPACRAWLRPHVLWFDECYDEDNYRYETAVSVAGRADLLIVVGTLGATSLPDLIGRIASAKGTPIIDINPEPNPFATRAEAAGGAAWRAPAGSAVPRLVDALRGTAP